MGYIVIKPQHGGTPMKEYFSVGKSRIYFSKLLCKKIGLLERQKSAVVLVDTETGALCFDFKDYGQMPDSHRVCVNRCGHGRSLTVFINCQWAIEHYGIPYGRHTLTREGCLWRSDCIVPQEKNK